MATNEHGYGHLRRDGRDYKAHRLAFELATGAIDPVLVVRHTCDNPPCCNPAHLVQGTVAQNQADSTERGRRARGARNGAAKLTEESVIEMRQLVGTMTYRELGERYGVDPDVARKAATGVTWVHV